MISLNLEREEGANEPRNVSSLQNLEENKEMDSSLKHPEGMQLGQHLNFSPVMLMSDF